MTKNPADLLLDQHLDYLKLPYLKENCQPLAAEGATNHWSHLDYLGRLIQGEVATRQDRVIARRVKAARFPVIKTLEAFRWAWPKPTWPQHSATPLVSTDIVSSSPTPST